MEFLIVILLFLIVFPLFWTGIIYLMSFLTGWHQMGKKYGTSYFPEDYKSNQSAQLGGLGNYNFVLKIAVKPEGLYMGVFFLFRPGHPNILIPWSEITEVSEKNIPLLFGKAYKLKVGQPYITSILLKAKLFEGFEERLREKMKV